MYRLFSCLFLAIFTLQSYAQDRTLDSLINRIKSERIDSDYYKTCIKIASIYSDSSYNKALDYYNMALNVAERSSDRKKVAHVYHQIGYMYQRKGEFPTALTNLKNALAIHEYIKNKKGIGQLLNDIGLIYRTWGKYEQALDNYFKALMLFDEIGDVGNGAMASNNIGQIYYYREEYVKAIDYFKKYLQVNIKNKAPRAIAGASNNIASAYMELENYDEALNYFVRSMRIYDSLGIKLGVAVIKDNIGTLFLRKKQYNDALLYHTDALKFFEETGSQPRLCYTLQNIGLVYTKLNKPDLAIEYLNRSLDLALKLKQRETQKDVHEALSDVYSRTKNYEQAFLNYKRYVQINDSLINAETVGKIESIQAEYEAQKKEKELSEINQKLHNQKIVLILSAGLFLLFIFFIVLFIRENFHKKRTIANSKEQTRSLYSLLSRTGNYILQIQNRQYISTSLFSKNWSINPESESQYPFLSYQINSYHCFAYGSSNNPTKGSNLIYLSVFDFFNSMNKIDEALNIHDDYQRFIASDHRWKEIFEEEIDAIGIDFWIYSNELKLLRYFGSSNAYIVNSEKQIKPLNNGNGLTVNTGDRFYLFTTNFNDTFNSPDGALLQETLSKTILKTIDLSFEEQREIFKNSLELIKAGDEYQSDISIFAFMV